MHQGLTPVETNAAGVTYQAFRAAYPDLGAEEARLRWSEGRGIPAKGGRLADPDE